MRTAELAAERFVVQRDIVQREYSNFFKEQPYQHAMYLASTLLELQKWHILEYLEYASSGDLTHEALTSFARGTLLSHVHIKALCHGNVSRADSEATLREGLAALKCAPLFASQLLWSYTALHGTGGRGGLRPNVSSQ